MMRKYALLTGAAALALAASRATADFAITAIRTDLGAANAITTAGNGTVPGNLSLTRFYARNLGAAGVVNQGTKLSSVSITMTDLGAGNLIVGGYNRASGTPQAGDAADLFGQHEISVVSGSYVYKETLTTTTSAPKYVSFFNILGDASVAADSNPSQILSPGGFTPANAYSNYQYAIKSFSADYSGTNAGVDATTANGGLGALFAVAVSPILDSINISGQLGGDSPQLTSFNFTSTIFPGDANLSGKVTFADAQILKANFNAASAVSWSKGDFNGDGLINSADAALLARNYNLGTGSLTPALASAAAVPEPSGISCLAAAGIVMMRRRRR